MACCGLKEQKKTIGMPVLILFLMAFLVIVIIGIIIKLIF
jgi:hypothetical protein